MDFTFITRHIHNSIISSLAQLLHSFWNYFCTLPQQRNGHLPTLGAHLLVSYLFAFSYCLWGSGSKSTGVVCHSLFQWTMFCQSVKSEFLLMRWSWWAHRELQYGKLAVRWTNNSVGSFRLTTPPRDPDREEELEVRLTHQLPRFNQWWNLHKNPFKNGHRELQSWTTHQPAGMVVIPNSMGTKAPVLGLLSELTQHTCSSVHSSVSFIINCDSKLKGYP